MPLFVLRSGVPVAVPLDYATTPDHRRLVDQLNHTTSYAEVVTVLDHHPDSFLAADILTGAPWAQRFLRTTARFALRDPKQARRGLRALMRVLNGTKVHVGRHRAPVVTVDVRDVLAHWRVAIDPVWGRDRVWLASAVVALAAPRFRLSRSHRRALAVMLRRTRLRKHDLVLTLVSWETGVPVRRLRSAQPVPDLIYR